MTSAIIAPRRIVAVSTAGSMRHRVVLVDAEIFSRDKRGVLAWYALRPAALQTLAAILGGTDS